MEGSKILTLALTTKTLFAQMKEHSYYIGEALKGDVRMMELSAKIQASDDDDSVLKDFVQAGGTKLGNLLSRVLGKTSYSWSDDASQGTTITFTTNAVANFMESQKDTLKDSMLNYLSYYVLSQWLTLIKPDEAQRFETQLERLEEDMRQLGAQRDKPKRSVAIK